MKRWLAQGIDFDGEEAIFAFETVQCPAGHRYDRDRLLDTGDIENA